MEPGTLVCKPVPLLANTARRLPSLHLTRHIHLLYLQRVMLNFAMLNKSGPLAREALIMFVQSRTIIIWSN